MGRVTRKTPFSLCFFPFLLKQSILLLILLVTKCVEDFSNTKQFHDTSWVSYIELSHDTVYLEMVSDPMG